MGLAADVSQNGHVGKEVSSKEASNIREDWAFQALQASLEEAHRYLRDVSRRIEEHVRFYLTVATASVGAIAYPFAAGATSMSTKAVLCLGTGALYGFGVIAFTRLISLKTQATQHTARKVAAEYNLLRMAFGDNVPRTRPETPQAPSGPFSREVVLILTIFYLCNSVVFSVFVVALIDALLEFAQYSAIRPRQYYSWSGISGALAFVSSLLTLRRWLQNGWRKAFVEYEQVLVERTAPPRD